MEREKGKGGCVGAMSTWDWDVMGGRYKGRHYSLSNSGVPAVVASMYFFFFFLWLGCKTAWLWFGIVLATIGVFSKYI